MATGAPCELAVRIVVSGGGTASQADTHFEALHHCAAATTPLTTAVMIAVIFMNSSSALHRCSLATQSWSLRGSPCVARGEHLQLHYLNRYPSVPCPKQHHRRDRFYVLSCKSTNHAGIVDVLMPPILTGPSRSRLRRSFPGEARRAALPREATRRHGTRRPSGRGVGSAVHHRQRLQQQQRRPGRRGLRSHSGREEVLTAARRRDGVRAAQRRAARRDQLPAHLRAALATLQEGQRPPARRAAAPLAPCAGTSVTMLLCTRMPPTANHYVPPKSLLKAHIHRLCEIYLCSKGVARGPCCASTLRQGQPRCVCASPAVHLLAPSKAFAPCTCVVVVSALSSPLVHAPAGATLNHQHPHRACLTAVVCLR